MQDLKILFPREKKVQLLPGGPKQTWGHQILFNILTAKGFDADAAQAMLVKDNVPVWPKCLWIAGGAALAAAQIDGPVSKRYGDIDVFITKEGFDELPDWIAERITGGLAGESLLAIPGFPRILADDLTVDAHAISPQIRLTSAQNQELTYVNRRLEPIVKLHVTSTLFDSIEDVMDKFDLDCCKVAVRPFDGEVRVSKDWKPYNIYRCEFGSDRYIWRLAKYAVRGFPVHIEYPHADRIRVPNNKPRSFTLNTREMFVAAANERAQYNAGKGLHSLLAFNDESGWQQRGVSTAYLQAFEKLARKLGGCYSFAPTHTDKIQSSYHPASYLSIEELVSNLAERVNGANNVSAVSVSTSTPMAEPSKVHFYYQSENLVCSGYSNQKPSNEQKPSICDDVGVSDLPKDDVPAVQPEQLVSPIPEPQVPVPTLSESNGYFPFCSFALGAGEGEQVLYCALANPKSLLVKVELTPTQIVFTLSEATHRSWFPDNATIIGKEILPTTLRFDWPASVKSRVSHRLFYRHSVQAQNGLVVVSLPLFPENEPETMQISLL